MMQVFSMYGMFLQKHPFSKVHVAKTVGVTSKYSAWKSIMPKTVITIELNDEVHESFVLGLIWGRIFLSIAPFSLTVDIVLTATRGVQYVISE
jgi:hypothetical protein